MLSTTSINISRELLANTNNFQLQRGVGTNINFSYTHLLVLALLLKLRLALCRESCPAHWHHWRTAQTPSEGFLFQHLSYFLFIRWLPLWVEAKLVFRSAHPEYLEPIYLWYELWRTIGHQLRVCFHEDMWKTCPKIRSVYVQLFWSRNVDVLASRTIHLDSGCGEFFWHTYREYILPLTKYSWTVAEWP